MNGLPRSQDRGTVVRLAVLFSVLLMVCGTLPIVGTSAVFGADTTFRAPAATASPNGWTNPANATNNTNDAVYATASGDNVDQGYRDFGFSIPKGTIIDGITVKANAFSSASSGCRIDVRLSWNNGSNSTSYKQGPLAGGVDDVLTFGAANDTWGRVWDPTELTDGKFRLELRNEDPGRDCPNGSTTSLDWVTAQVTYRTINQGTANAALGDAVCDAADFNFVIDMSGSIGTQGSVPSNLPDLKSGITEFVTGFQSAGGDGRYSGTRFNASSTAALTSGYTSAATFNAAVDGLNSPSGLTPTGAGITAAAGNNANDRAGVTNVMFVVTDGSPNKPNSHGDDLTNPDTWYTGANAATAAANAARAGSGASKYVVKAVYLSTAGDPGDTNLPFSPAGDAQWATEVMDQIGGGSHLDADFSSFVDDLFNAIGCPPPSMKITKVADDASVDAGAQIGFTVKVKNEGGKAAHNVVVTDNLPDSAGTNWSVSPAVAGCSVTGSPGSQALTCDFGTVAAGETKTVHVVTGTGTSCGKYDNTASFTSTEGQTGSDSASVTVRCADVKVTKTPNDGSVNAGETATFTISVENLGPGKAKSVIVTDQLPAGLTWTENEADCSISNTGLLTCNVGDMANGATKTYTVSAPTAKANCGAINNSATVSSVNEPAGADGNNTDAGKITVKCAKIEVDKTADAASVSAGDPIGFTITVRNAGDGTAYGVTATDSLNPAFTWAIEPSAGWTLTGTTLSLSAAQLAGGASSAVHVTAPTSSELCRVVPNSASASSTSDGSDEASAQTEILCPDVTVLKKAVASPVSAGDPIAFDITVSNAGPGTAKAVTLSDTLPAGITWAENSTACTISGGILSCNFGDLGKDATATVRVSGTTTPDVCGSVPNTATVAASNEPQAKTTNNSSTDTVVVNCPDVTVLKKAVASPVSAGDPIAFDITVSNAGPGTAKAVTLSDTLPAGITWAENSTACTISGGILSCNFGDLGKDATATVRVSGTTTPDVCGSVPNTATVAASNEPQAKTTNNSSTDTVVVNCPDLKVTKVADNSPISAGDVASYTIQVENIGKGTAKNVNLTDELPAGIDWATDTSGCTITDGTLDCAFGDILPGLSRTVQVSGETDAEDCKVLPNEASSTAGNEPQDLLANNKGSASITVNCAAVEITKSTVTPVVSATDTISFDIVVTNTGDGSAYGVTVSDPLPTTNGTSWSIDAANTTGAWSIDNGTLTFGPADLAGGASVKVRIVSSTTPASCGPVRNTASLTYRGGSDSDGSSLVVECPDVTISKTAANSPILAGQTASYTISAWNEGPGTAYGVVITDTVPAGIAWTVDNDSCSILEGVLTCEVGTLAKGDKPFTVTLSGPTARADCGDLPNMAEVSATNEATGPEGATGNNRDEASIAVLCPSASITKTNDTEGKVAPGTTVGYTLALAVQNGPIATMTVKDVLPANFGTPSAISDGGTYEEASRTITWTLANVANGKQLTYDVVIATETQGGSYTNTATITEGPCVAGDCDDTSVVPVWRVAIDKSNNATKPLLAGADVVYTLAFAVQNGPITSMVVTDTLPAQVVNPRNFSVAPVSVKGQVITWNLEDVADGRTITYTASIAAGTVIGSYKNVAVITQGPCVDAECTDDSVVNTGQVEEATGTPTITPPPTDTLSGEPGQSGSSLLLILFAITGLVAVLGVLTPAPARVRRQRRRG